MNTIFRSDDIMLVISLSTGLFFKHSNLMAKFFPENKSTPNPTNHRNLISSSTHLFFNCCRRLKALFDRQTTKRIKTRAKATVPTTTAGARVSRKEETVEFSTATNEYTIMISIVAKPQAMETVNDILPSEFPSSAGLPKLSGLSNKKLMM